MSHFFCRVQVLCVSWLGPERIASGGADSVLRICEVKLGA
jgi:hypothetical protein